MLVFKPDWGDCNSTSEWNPAFEAFALGFSAGVYGVSIDQWKKRQANRRYQSANREKLREHYAKKRAEARAARPPRVKKGRDPEKRRASQRRHYERHREQLLVKAAEYRKQKPMVYGELPEHQRRSRTEYKRQKRRQAGAIERKHDAHVKSWERHEREVLDSQRNGLCDSHVRLFFADWTRVYRWRYQHDPEFRLKELLRRQLKKKQVRLHEQAHAAIHMALRGKTKGGSIERIVGYTLADLRTHLERQFIKKMSWDSRGKAGWHIDHIRPKKCFDLTTIEGVRDFWALSNLRPLWARDNLQKRDRVEVLV